MAQVNGNKYVAIVSGFLQEVYSAVSGGASGTLVALDANGKLDATIMPTGIGADTKDITASEALAAGDFVNIYNSSGVKCRKADASVAGKQAHGFVKAQVNQNATATVYLGGTNDQCSALTPGPVWLSATAGLSTGTPPSGSGQVVQKLGAALSATEIAFEPGDPITLVT